eukprot:FR735246.1.p2 GENE.FR735246.1~~FR735246.1.p2  ORF type:complete len:109 (+),score=44.14 FR735246.1:895-1221(+)
MKSANPRGKGGFPIWAPFPFPRPLNPWALGRSGWGEGYPPPSQWGVIHVFPPNIVGKIPRKKTYCKQKCPSKRGPETPQKKAPPFSGGAFFPHDAPPPPPPKQNPPHK